MTPATRETGKAHAAGEAETHQEHCEALNAATWLAVICERHRVMRWGKRTKQ